MISLTRPHEGRLIAGVCAAMEGAYGVPVLLVRAIFIVSFIVNPVILLMYLLLSLSIPSERSVISEMRLRDREERASGFSHLSTFLLDRASIRSGNKVVRQRYVTALLLIAMVVFQIPRLEGDTFHQLHPMVDSIAASLSRVSGVLLYLLSAAAFLLYHRTHLSPVVLRNGITDRLAVQRGEMREIGGLAAGIARVIRVDVAWIRVFLLLLNILTLGFLGALYFVIVWLLRRTGQTQNELSVDRDEYESTDRNQTGDKFPIIASGLLLSLAIIRLSTELRLFYFNESLLQGIIHCVLGILFTRRRGGLWQIIGAALLLLGVYDLCSAIFHVQPGVAGRWQVAYLVAALTIIYFALVALRGQAILIAMSLAGAAFLALLFVSLQITSEDFLLALVRFYDFFYPLIFAGLGLWVARDG
ncbi:MAG: PspC domain-containing protein [Bacteroidota bacterium]|nr:PspC domain-containing protein [Bacteroidota bacterium]MDP4233514.1 PspC domain-containing protein [Bacteroidota bacterium]MDP4243391.1 PspC domain-containing protein [Bacteroidota bacterium]MDP4287922.1 PspC domain-containing protein [Bacteroidota bacterium]